jgi:hypothetical protein
MKSWIYWVAGGIELLIVISLSIILAITKSSFWWLFGIALFFLVLDVTIGLYLLYANRTLPLEDLEKNPEEVVEIICDKIKKSEDNPDNLTNRTHITYTIGETGIKIMKISGIGSELGHKITALVNLNNKKVFDWSRLKDDASEEFIQKEVLRMAGFPEANVSEEIQTGYDDFGRPIKKVFSKRISPQQKKEEEEVKELEEENVA